MKTTKNLRLFVAVATAVFSLVACAGDCAPASLRCEYLVNPLGIDETEPRLSWIVESGKRDQRQTAYRVLVASSGALLDKDVGDLWDSGKVASSETTGVVYSGKPLASGRQCVWKLKVWDVKGRESSWSPAASWTMGLLQASNWGDAKWIASVPDPSLPPPHNGYSSTVASSPDAVKWVAIDLGEACRIDAVRLFPATPFDMSYTPGFAFPLRFKIEVAGKADFSDAKTVVDQTGANVPNPRKEPLLCRFESLSARHVRLTVTRMAKIDKSQKRFAFALAEMQVLSGPQNVAKFASVTALDSIEKEDRGWSKGRLVDDRVLPDPSNDSVGPATMVRKEFDLHAPVKRAVVSVTGLGLYELRLNGQRVGDQLLAPEWTRYSSRIQYQTYDVSGLLRAGRNAVGAQVSGGWWTGLMHTLPHDGKRRVCFLMRLEVELADGSTQTIVTDPSWQAYTDGPIRHAGIYFGETYDATKEMPGWDQPAFVATGWRPVQVLPYPEGAEKAALVAQRNEPIRVVRELWPVKMTEPKPGMYVFDMGQNMVGWCRLKVNAPAGTKITLRHGEMLNDDGTIYTANLRGAAQLNEYIWRGGEDTLEPHFTYHGFRYVELTGLPGRPAADAIIGRVFCSSARDVGSFSCSSDLINKIMHCVEWVQRGNLMGVPTDCPQRSERLGWMGDIQAFAQTTLFQMDVAGFFTKWFYDIRDSQASDGRYPSLAPHIGDPNRRLSGVPAWGDAGTIVPWHMYQNYADTRMLEQHYDSARRWVEFIHSNNTNLLWRENRGDDYNDWLNGDTQMLKNFPRGISAVPNEVFATAFFAHSVEIVAKMAGVLGRKDDAVKYGQLFDEIKSAFNKQYVAADGRITGDTQAGYALALHFNLLAETLRPQAVTHMLEAIKKYNDHLSTGIQTTHRLMLELTRNGHHDEACRLINLRTAPSWGHMVDNGATTIWERWDGYVKGRGLYSPGMNSFNHYALGAVGEWVYRDVAGINPDEEQPGYKHVIIRPRLGGGLTWVKARYDSIRGPIVSEWEIADGRFHLHVEIPANAKATVYVPAAAPLAVTENGRPLAQAVGVKFLRMEGGCAVLAVESGSYHLRALPETQPTSIP